MNGRRIMPLPSHLLSLLREIPQLLPSLSLAGWLARCSPNCVTQAHLLLWRLREKEGKSEKTDRWTGGIRYHHHLRRRRRRRRRRGRIHQILCVLLRLVEQTRDKDLFRLRSPSLTLPHCSRAKRFSPSLLISEGFFLI